MNRPSLDKFEKVIVPGGLLVMDSDLVNREPERKDIKVIKMTAQEEAEKIGSKTIASMVLLVGFVAKTKIVPMDALLKALKDHGKEKYYAMNEKAIKVGEGYIK